MQGSMPSAGDQLVQDGVPEQVTGCPSSEEIFFNGVPLSHYSLTEAEVVQNRDNVDWFLTKMFHFGSAIGGVKEIRHLIPGPISDTLFGGLMHLVREFPKFPEAEILQNPNITQLRSQVIQNCGIAEYCSEVWYATRVISNEVSLPVFDSFGSYERAMSFEIQCIKTYLSSTSSTALNRTILKVAFIGSGPLPLSAIEIIPHLPEEGTVINYDQSAEAVEIGQSIIAMEGLSHRISFVHASALGIDNLREMDIVYLAAAIGGTQAEKRKIMEHLYRIMKPFSLLVARSAVGLRTFMYERMTKEDFGQFSAFQHFDPLDKMIINSIAIGMKMD